jgi:hypothetical protein
VGFYPVRVPVDIIANASPVQISLFTLKAMLDTVKVATSRLSRGMQTGFDDRRRIGAGTYITPSDVVKHRPNVTSDLFRFFHGVRVASNNPPERNFEMRGAFANTCKPEIYINDHFMSDIGPDELDSWVRPNELEGIEIYSEASVPPQFHRSLAECGAIVIWTKGW